MTVRCVVYVCVACVCVCVVYVCVCGVCVCVVCGVCVIENFIIIQPRQTQFQNNIEKMPRAFLVVFWP